MSKSKLWDLAFEMADRGDYFKLLVTEEELPALEERLSESGYRLARRWPKGIVSYHNPKSGGRITVGTKEEAHDAAS